MIDISFADIDDIDFFLKNTSLSKDQIITKLGNNEMIIARQEKKQIGLLVLDRLWNHIPFISYIWVTELARAKGVGRSLLKLLEEYLVKNGEDVLFSSSMETARDAQKWHIKMGFTETGVINNINDNNVGEIFYRKDLS